MWPMAGPGHFHVLRSLIATGIEGVSAVVRRDFLDGIRDGVPEFEAGSGFPLLENRLEF